MNDRQILRKIAFLDTNTLHFIGLYLECAKEKNLYPFGNSEGAIVKSREELTQISEKGLRDNLKKGLETIAYLKKDKSIEVEYAPVSELELLNGRIRGMAIVSAANEGIPDRMWTRFRENEIRERVSSSDLERLKEKIENTTLILEEAGVAVKSSDKERAGDVLDLAKGISSLVYMQTMDCIIYSSAIVAQADYLFTTDENLRKTINQIYGLDGNADYEAIRLKLQELVSPITLKDREQVELPSAHTVTKEGNLKPDLPASQSGGSS